MNEMKLSHLYDFYFLEAIRAGLSMAKSANAQNEFKHSFVRLESDVEDSFKSLADTMAKRIRLYLFASALGEARHAQRCVKVYAKNIPANGGRGYVYEQTKKFALNNENTQALLDIFGQTGWGGAYGGKAWKNIVEAMDLYGKVSDATFIDHTVDLQHNGGTIFSKDTRGTDVKFDPYYNINKFLDLKFKNNILTDGIEAVVSYKVKHLLERYGNIVEKVNLKYIEASLQWLEPFDVEMGEELLVLNTSKEYVKVDYTPRRESPTCYNCGCRISEDDHCHDPNEHCICESCYDENYSYCGNCGETVEEDEIVSVDGDDMCKSCAKNRAAECYDCGEWTKEYFTAEDSDDAYCENCYSNNVTFCELCESDYKDIQYHNEHEHKDVYCKECQEIVEDMTEHILEEHYEPVELQESECFDNVFEPIEPYNKIGEVKVINGETWEVWYEKDGLKIVKNGEMFSFLPSNMNLWFGKKSTIQQAVETFEKLTEMVEWSKVFDITDWNVQVSQETKNQIYKLTYGG